MWETVLQTGLLYETRPPGLPIWLLVVGLQLLIFGGLRKASRGRLGAVTASPRGRLGLVLIGSGYLFAALSVIQTNYGPYAAFLFVLFRGLEGAATVRFYRKVEFVVNNRRLPSGAGMATFVTHRLLVFFFTIVGAGLLVMAIAPGAAERAGFSVANPQGVYTVTTFSLALLGVYWRLSPVQSDYNWLVIAGFGLSIAGAELFNYATVGTELALTVAGGVAYVAGFWLLIACWALGLVPTNP